MKYKIGDKVIAVVKGSVRCSTNLERRFPYTRIMETGESGTIIECELRPGNREVYVIQHDLSDSVFIRLEIFIELAPDLFTIQLNNIKKEIGL